MILVFFPLNSDEECNSRKMEKILLLTWSGHHGDELPDMLDLEEELASEHGLVKGLLECVPAPTTYRLQLMATTQQ